MLPPSIGPTIRQAAILVGGLGTRLGALAEITPKSLQPCGDRPFLAWLLRELCRFGIEEAVLLTGHMADAIEAALPEIAASLPKKIRIICSREEQRSGTGGALYHARNHLAERFLVCNGDSWLDFNLARLLAEVARDPEEVVGRMVLHPLGDAGRYGVAEIQGDRVIRFRERPEPGRPGMINAGLYVFNRLVLEAITPVCSLERDVLPWLAAGGRLRGTVANGYFVDIGVPADLSRAQVELPTRLRRRALFLNREGVINVDHDWVGTRERSDFAPGALAVIRAATAAAWHVFVVTSQSGIARGLYSEAQFADLCSWMIAAIRVESGNIDDLRYCPSHPEASVAAYRRVGDWRKPGPAMLLDLLARWQLDPAHCLLIGGQPSDLAAAAAAGIPAHLFPGGDLAAFATPLLAEVEHRLPWPGTRTRDFASAAGSTL